ETKFVVKDKGFGIVQLSTSYDAQGALAAPAGGVAGQSIFVNFWTVGYTRGANKQPNLQFQMYMLDENNQKTLPVPVEGQMNNGVPADAERIPMQFPLPLNRVGKFTLVLQAKDANSNKTSEVKVPIAVQEQK